VAPDPTALTTGRLSATGLSRMINGRDRRPAGRRRQHHGHRSRASDRQNRDGAVIDATFATLEQDSIQAELLARARAGKQVLASLPPSFGDTLARPRPPATCWPPPPSDRTSRRHRWPSIRRAHGRLSTPSVSAPSRQQLGPRRRRLAPRSPEGPPFAARPVGHLGPAACFTPSSASYQPIQQAVGSLRSAGSPSPWPGIGDVLPVQLTSTHRPPPWPPAAASSAGPSSTPGSAVPTPFLAAASKRVDQFTVDPRYGGWTNAGGRRRPAGPSPAAALPRCCPRRPTCPAQPRQNEWGDRRVTGPDTPVAVPAGSAHPGYPCGSEAWTRVGPGRPTVRGPSGWARRTRAPRSHHYGDPSAATAALRADPPPSFRRPPSSGWSPSTTSHEGCGDLRGRVPPDRRRSGGTQRWMPRGGGPLWPTRYPVPPLVANGRRASCDKRAGDVEVTPALSFLDLAWARSLGIDPVASKVQLGGRHHLCR